MKKTAIFHVAWITTLLYCLLTVTVVCIFLMGCHSQNRQVFELGSKLLPVWMFNPMGLIVSVIGIVIERLKWFYGLCLAITTVVWLVAGLVVAPYF